MTSHDGASVLKVTDIQDGTNQSLKKCSLQVQPPCQPLHPALPPPGLYLSLAKQLISSDPSSSLVLSPGEHLLEGLNCRHLAAG